MEVCVCVYLHAQMLVSKEVVVFMCVQRDNIKTCKGSVKFTTFLQIFPPERLGSFVLSVFFVDVVVCYCMHDRRHIGCIRCFSYVIPTDLHNF